ncbi:MAG TPA: AI-2E family transporter [Herpetosiphonaceae bacterium]
MDERRNEVGGRPEIKLPESDIKLPALLRLLARWALVAGVIWLIVWILRRSGATLTPFIIGLVMAYLLLPIVKKLDRYMPRWASITTVYLVGLILFELIVVFVVPPTVAQVQQFTSNIPEWFDRSNQFVNDRIADFQRSAPQEVQDQVNTQVRNAQQTLQRNASTYAQRVGEFLLNTLLSVFQTITFLLGFLIIPFFLFYILLDTNKLPRAIDVLLHPRIRPDFWNIWRIVDGVFGRYIRGQLVLGLIIGATSFIGLTVLNMFGFNIRYTVLLAIIAGIGELIPVVGPIISAIPAILVAIGDGWSAVGAVVVLYVLIQQLENQILVPRIVGNTLKLHAAILMALLVIAGSVGGLGLVILSAPLAAIGRDVFIYLHRRLREPPQPPTLAISDLVPEETPEQPPKQPVQRSRPAVSKTLFSPKPKRD